MYRASLLFALLASPVVISAQENDDEWKATSRKEILQREREKKADNLEPYEVSESEKRLLGWEKKKFPQNWLVKGWRGFRPVFGGMPSGSGTVIGGGYIHGLEAQYFQLQANARFSTRGYTTADAELVLPPPQIGRRVELKFRAEYRDLTALSFFGIGNDSSRENESSFLLNDQSATAYLWLNPRGLLSLGVQGGFLTSDADRGTHAPSIEEVFPPEQVPGSDALRTDYIVTGGWIEFDIRDKWAEPPVGFVARVTAVRYEDTKLDEFDFTRVVADIKGYISLGTRNRILALRLRTSHSIDDDDDQVPFYLMETLGGAKTIRAYDEFRFRDARNLYVSAEYRWEVWPLVDFSFFFDAGKVFDDLDDFNFDKMHTGYGAGLRIHTPGGMAFRMDVARSTEGYKLHISGGPTF
ncbi:MAG: BamA/TamA family outer membrane protein [Acidobacteriota bacterium]|nr:MAG: BamA/TamA family outer membrane protein [Acidobacteriota bacterium]